MNLNEMALDELRLLHREKSLEMRELREELLGINAVTSALQMEANAAAKLLAANTPGAVSTQVEGTVAEATGGP